MRKYLLAILFLTLTSAANAQNVSTIAGTNIHAFYNGTPATTAQLAAPGGLYITESGMLYITDGNYAIRMIDTHTGIMKTVAGNSTQGYSGDGGPASAAQLTLTGSGPLGTGPAVATATVAADNSGNIYIANSWYSDNTIRKVTSAGIISTIAGGVTSGYTGDGGMATAATINASEGGVAVDGAGNLYLADMGNNRIREISTAGFIMTVAGDGTGGYSGDGILATTAEVGSPFNVAFDGTGNMYISDFGNNRIRMVGTSGYITTIAGTGTSGFSGDGGAATLAKINQPTCVATDAHGNIYIADYGNNRIRKISSSTITTVAGNGTAGYTGDGGSAISAQINCLSIAVDTAGNIYLSDPTDNCIRMVSTGGIISTIAGNKGYGGDGAIATASQLETPADVCRDANDNIYVADKGNHTVRVVNNSTSIITTIAGTGVAGYSGDGAAATNAMLNEPGGVAINSSGDIYISDLVTQRVRVVNHTTGIITTVAGNGTAGYSGDSGPATSAALNGPLGIAIDTAGNLYISDNGNNRIRKVDIATNIISTYAGTGVVGYTGDGSAATAAQVNGPAYIAFDTANNLYIADENNNVIRMVNAATGIITTVFGNGTSGDTGDGGPATTAELCSPVGIAIDHSGGISTTVCGKIKHIPGSSGGGPVSVIAGNGLVGMSPNNTPALSAVFNGPAGICYDAAGHLIIADANNRVVRGLGLTGTGVQNIPVTGAQIKIIPNPNTGVFELSGAINDNSKEITVSIVNVLGREVYHAPISVNNGAVTGRIILDKNLPGGVYYCRVMGGAEGQSISFLLQR